MNRFGSIYLVTNKHTGELYVGQTTKTVAHRWYAHTISAKKPLFKFAKAIALHGAENFLVRELFVAFDKSALDAAEKEIISDLNPTYNMTKGGAGQSLPVVSPEVCKKRSVAALKRWATPEWRAKTILGIQLGARKPETRAKVEQRVLSGEARAIMIKANAARWEGHIKPIHVPIDRAELTREQWKNPDIRARRIEGLKAAQQRPEVKEKIRLASTGRVMPRTAVEKSRKAKFIRVTCIELGVSFLSMLDAAAYLGVNRTTITESIKRKRKINKMYTIIKVDQCNI